MSIKITMDGIRNTQTLTRFLRSKDASLENILDVADKTLNEAYSFTLPNRDVFIFELLCDRIGDAKFKNWKFDARVWKLFTKLWNLILNTDTRNRIFRRLKFLDTLCKIFNNFFEIQGDDFFSQLLEASEAIHSQFDLQADDNTCFSFIVAFVNIFETDTEDSIVVAWTRTAKVLFKTSQNTIDYVVSKKSSTKFFQTCLPKLLNTIQNLDHNLEPCISILTSIIEENIFGKELTTALQANFEQYLKSKEQVSFESISLLYKIIIQRLGNKDIKLCEDLYLSIISTTKYSQMSESLMEVLSSCNRPLSTEFFTNVYENSIEQKPMNWKLLTHIIDLDVSLAMEKSNSIIKLLNEEKTEVSKTFIPSLINAFVRARDLFEFFTEVWLSNIKANDVWASEEVLSSVSDNVNDLSSSQIIKITEYLLQKGMDVYPMYLSLLRGLFQCSVEKRETIEDAIWNNKDIIVAELSWELRFHLLMNYPNKSEDLLQTAGLKPKHYSKYYFLFIFRLVEVNLEYKMAPTIEPEFIKYLKGEDEGFCITLLKRWCIIVDKFFTESGIKKVVDYCFKTLSLECLSKFLKYDGAIFFEQGKLVSAAISFILKQQNEAYLKLISEIPIQCFTRSDRAELIEILTEKSDSAEPLNHVLQHPTFKTSIETSLDQLINVLDRGADYQETFKLIWNHHLKQAKSDNSFVSESIKSLKKLLKKLNIGITNNLVAIGLVCNNTDHSLLPEAEANSIGELREAYISTLEKLLDRSLNESFNESEIVQYLSLIYDALQYDSCSISQEFVKKIGKHTRSIENYEINCLLFQLLARTADISCYKHVLAVYAILFKEGDHALNESLITYFSKLSKDAKFDEVSLFILSSMNQSITPSNAALFTSLLKSITKTLIKNEISELKVSVIVSLVSTHLTSMSSSLENMILVLDIFKSCLTEKSWSLSQYSIEQMISIIVRLSNYLEKLDASNAIVEQAYILSTQIIANILLFHRFRLTSRHHLIISVFSALLSNLTLKSRLNSSSSCSAAYGRLLSNLCEPSSNSKGVVSKHLTTSSNIIKKQLRSFLPVLLVNYISLSLRQNFSRENNNEILSGVFIIFDVLTQKELEVTNNWLDSQGVVLYKSLYNDYKDHGKWKDN